MTEREDIVRLMADSAVTKDRWKAQHHLNQDREEWECRMDKRIRFLETAGAKWNGAAIVIGTILATIGGTVIHALIR